MSSSPRTATLLGTLFILFSFFLKKKPTRLPNCSLAGFMRNDTLGMVLHHTYHKKWKMILLCISGAFMHCYFSPFCYKIKPRWSVSYIYPICFWIIWLNPWKNICAVCNRVIIVKFSWSKSWIPVMFEATPDYAQLQHRKKLSASFKVSCKRIDRWNPTHREWTIIDSQTSNLISLLFSEIPGLWPGPSDHSRCSLAKYEIHTYYFLYLFLDCFVNMLFHTIIHWSWGGQEGDMLPERNGKK